jgi:hypothetical protein
MFRRFMAAAVTTASATAVIGLTALPAAAQPTTQASAATAPRASGPTAVVTKFVKRYHIITRTADEFWAGTDATVRIKVYGFAATSPGYVNLDNSDDNFEAGHTDVFGPFSWDDLGGVDFIGVFKGNNGSDWHLSYVDVYDQLNNVTSHCPTSTDPSNGYYPSSSPGKGLTQWFDCP